MTAPQADLALADLTVCEQIIERGLGTFVEVGQALVRIRNGRLYRADFPTFETYCESRWSMSRRRDPRPSHRSRGRALDPLPSRVSWPMGHRFRYAR